MNNITRSIFRAIHEGRWLSIEYKNQQTQQTKYWVAIRGLNPRTRTLNVDGLHLGKLSVQALDHISIDRIQTAEVVDGSWCPVNQTLIDDIRDNPGRYAALFDNAANLRVLDYLAACNRLDATPYQSGGVYIVGDTGFEMYNYVDSLAKNYGEIVTSVADQLSGVSTVYALAVPLSSGITLPDALYSDIPGSDQAQAEKDILAAMGKNVKTVPLHDVMMSHRGEYIYFRTDHHWTGLGAYYAYREFCGAKGVTPHALSEYEVSQYDGFLGSFYNDGGKPDAMKNNPDVVTAYHPISTEARMQYGKSDSDLTAGKIIYDESEASAGLKYGAFIMGDNPYTVISNPDLSDGSSCVVVKESFGNAFVPFLVDHYQTVYVIDYRYYSGSVVDFAKTNKVTDVIFVNNLSAIRGSYQMGKLAGVK